MQLNVLICSIAILFSLSAKSYGQDLIQPDPKVRVAYYTEYDICLASRSKLGPKGQRPVLRSAPQADAKVLGQLKVGHVVSVCDDRSPWFGIVDNANGDPNDYGLGGCDAHKEGIAEGSYEYEGPCISGWIHRDYLTELAG